MNDSRLFDLNIEKILEAWDNAHAVRELIANALDEAVLTTSSDVEIGKDGVGRWVIRDFGRGLRYEHFTQNENPEKLRAIGRVIGKFGVGLKDAMATLDRNRVRVEIESRYGVITLAQRGKHGFGDVVTLHAAVNDPRDPGFVGTAVRLEGLADADMHRAKSFFLRFSNERVLEETRVGQILSKMNEVSRIYVAGLLIAEEENFAFSYNITSLTEPMKKALNRERTHVGRTAYSERVKAMLLQTQSQFIAKTLASELMKVERGTQRDEVGWKDVAVHACKLLNANGKFLFVTSTQLILNANAIDKARNDGVQIVTIPDSIHHEIAGSVDVMGIPIRDLGVYETEWNDSFSFEWITVNDMNSEERSIFNRMSDIAALVGGLPGHVRAVRISRTMRQDFVSGSDALGLWDPETSSIVVRRDQLKSLQEFSATLLHELAHARSGHGDVKRQFEEELTQLLGRTAAAALAVKEPVRKGFWKG